MYFQSHRYIKTVYIMPISYKRMCISMVQNICIGQKSIHIYITLKEKY